MNKFQLTVEGIVAHSFQRVIDDTLWQQSCDVHKHEDPRIDAMHWEFRSTKNYDTLHKVLCKLFFEAADDTISWELFDCLDKPRTDSLAAFVATRVETDNLAKGVSDDGLTGEPGFLYTYTTKDGLETHWYILKVGVRLLANNHEANLYELALPGSDEVSSNLDRLEAELFSFVHCEDSFS